MQINSNKCVGCGACIISCAVEAITLQNGKAVIEQSRCIKCRMCLIACKVSAVSM